MVTVAVHTVLVVDDERTIRENLERLLKLGNFEPAVAASGGEALERLSKQEYEAVLLDIKMPGLSGMDILRRLRADHPDTYVIMVTAVSDVETAIEAMKLGAYDYVLKPFNLDEILLRVQKAIRARELELQQKEFQKQLEQRLGEQERELRRLTVQAVQAVIREASLSQELAPNRKPPKERTGADIRRLGDQILQRLRGTSS
ncbi:MAG: response regulator [Chloroflexi bacterium]|nr:response regulator [Chloroflexota bacterium]